MCFGLRCVFACWRDGTFVYYVVCVFCVVCRAGVFLLVCVNRCLRVWLVLVLVFSCFLLLFCGCLLLSDFLLVVFI